MDVSVIIVNYNVREFLQQAVAAVRRATGNLRVEIIVVDNNSVDGSAESIRTNFPDVRLIRNTSNVGFGRANNQAIHEAAGKYLLILNPDTIVQEDTIRALVDFMLDHADAGAVGCQILNPDGSFARESRRAFPTPRVAFYRISGLSRLFPGNPRFGRYNLTYLPVDEVAEVDALSGSCMMIRRDALCIPYDAENLDGSVSTDLVRLFDEDFFMYGEDLDLCYRIQAAGWKIYYTPATRIIHYKGESTRKGDLLYVRLFYGAMILFAEKHFAGRSRLLRLVLRLAIVVRAGVSVVQRWLRRLLFPALDFVLVYGSVVGVAVAWPGTTHRALTGLFLLTVPLVYSASTVAQIQLAGGYRHTRQRLRHAAVGVIGAMAFVAALSFFAKTVAFSRVVIVASVVPAFVLLAGWRVMVNRRSGGLRRAVVVGRSIEAEKLDSAISTHDRPPFVVAGYVADTDSTTSRNRLPRLGSSSQLRDIVRIHAIDEIIFAANGLPNQAVLSLMQTLRDLPVEFKTLVADGSHIIGKARVEDLSIPLLPAVATHGRMSPSTGRRLAHRLLAVLGLLMRPFVEAVCIVIRRPALFSLRSKMRALHLVVLSRLSLIGYHKGDGFIPPAEWNITEGLFSVSETLSIRRPTPADLERAWLFYAHSRSISLDLGIVFRSLRGSGYRHSQ